MAAATAILPGNQFTSRSCMCTRFRAVDCRRCNDQAVLNMTVRHIPDTDYQQRCGNDLRATTNVGTGGHTFGKSCSFCCKPGSVS